MKININSGRKMVYKRSEYGHQFKVSSLQKNIPVYKENLTYRTSRRERECAHTPIAWQDQFIEESDSDETLSQEDRVDELPVSKMAIIDEDQESDEEDNKVSKEKQDDLEIDLINQDLVCDPSEKDVAVTKQNETLRKQARAKLNKFITKDIQENLDQPVKVKEASEKKCLGKTFIKPRKADDRAFSKCSKPRRPDRQNKIPVARPGSAPAYKKTENKEGIQKPFVAYGCGGRESALGGQKTFNIRASSSVYPAALRAQKRNLLAIEKRQEKEQKASAREKRKKALFNERMARETISWISEYRRCFPAYEDTRYATSDKDPRRQKSYFTS